MHMLSTETCFLLRVIILHFNTLDYLSFNKLNAPLEKLGRRKKKKEIDTIRKNKLAHQSKLIFKHNSKYDN